MGPSPFHAAMNPEIATSSSTTRMTEVANSFANTGSTFALPYRNVEGGLRSPYEQILLTWYISDRIGQRLQIHNGDHYFFDFVFRIKGYVHHYRQAFDVVARLACRQLS